MATLMLSGRYEVGGLVGTGGMAEVFAGHDRLLARKVAVKVLAARYARDPLFVARFKREAQAAASLSHPNIVAVYDTGQDGDTSFIVMEYVEGRTLREVLRAEGPLPAERACQVGTEVCRALGAAHARGLIHRDIKPGNVMCTPVGGVKVMDFGIARAVAGEALTQTSAVVGTAAYLSPEQAQGLPVDFRSDLYALGCCLYEMVTGVVPFSGSTPVAVAYRHVREAPTPPRQLNPQVPVGLEGVVLKALAKRPEDRHQSAAELGAALAGVLSGGKAVAAGDPVPSTVAQTAVLGTPTTTSAGAAATSVFAAPARAGAPRRRARRRIPGWLAWTAAVLLLAVPVAFFMVRALGGLGVPARTTVGSSAAGPLFGEPTSSTLPAIGATPSTAATSTAPTTSAPPPSTTAPAPSSTRPALRQVPDVRRLRAGRAVAQLGAAGFVVRTFDVQVQQRFKIGRVVAQVPGPGSSRPAGSVVMIGVGVRGGG